MASFKHSHDSLSLVQISLAGGNASGTSSVAVVMSMESGREVLWYVSGVPHMPQNLRVTPGEEPKLAGRPRRKPKSQERNTAHATDGAPLARRQDRQWQSVSAVGSPVAR
jgi:hypothetical protein